MNLVEWFKGMVGSRQGEELLDPKINVRPSPRALKRALLVCLRCIDMDASKRPKMGQIVHMLDSNEFPFRGVSIFFLVLVFIYCKMLGLNELFCDSLYYVSLFALT